jgi:hypothetical protein
MRSQFSALQEYAQDTPSDKVYPLITNLHAGVTNVDVVIGIHNIVTKACGKTDTVLKYPPFNENDAYAACDAVTLFEDLKKNKDPKAEVVTHSLKSLDKLVIKMRHEYYDRKSFKLAMQLKEIQKIHDQELNAFESILLNTHKESVRETLRTRFYPVATPAVIDGAHQLAYARQKRDFHNTIKDSSGNAGRVFAALGLPASLQTLVDSKNDLIRELNRQKTLANALKDFKHATEHALGVHSKRKRAEECSPFMLAYAR